MTHLVSKYIECLVVFIWFNFKFILLQTGQVSHRLPGSSNSLKPTAWNLTHSGSFIFPWNTTKNIIPKLIVPSYLHKMPCQCTRSVNQLTYYYRRFVFRPAAGNDVTCDVVTEVSACCCLVNIEFQATSPGRPMLCRISSFGLWSTRQLCYWHSYIRAKCMSQNNILSCPLTIMSSIYWPQCPASFHSVTYARPIIRGHR